MLRVVAIWIAIATGPLLPLAAKIRCMDRIGRYRIISEVGRGAMGVVYRAADPSIGREVALKTVRLDVEGRDKLRERLFREARSAGVLSHPGIVTIYDMGDEDGLAYIAMALVRGPSLEALLSAPEPMSGARFFSILRQTAIALDYAHSRGVVHRDIKPGNIMTDEDGYVKITDFGIARFASAKRLNETRTITGTPNYMSPEQVQGLDADGRTDQFSLGVVAWEMLTGEKPFSGDNLSTVVYRIVSEEPLPAQHLNGTLTPRIDEVLRRALAKDPAKRFANCAGFVGALEMACAESPGWMPVAVGAAASLPTIGTQWSEVVPGPSPVRAAEAAAPAVEAAAPAVEAAAPAVEAAAPAVERAKPAPKRARAWWWLAAGVLTLIALGAVWLGAGGQPWQPEQTTDRALSPVVHGRQQPDQPVEVPPVVQSDPVPEPPQPARPEPGEAERASTPQQPTGLLQDLRLASAPAGARVILDNNTALSCETPCVLHARPGTHHINISLAGYRNEYREFHVQDAALDLTPITLQQVMGTLMLSSTPDGATVTVDGIRAAQTTPSALPLKPGSHVLVVEKGGMQHSETVQVGEGTVYLHVTLR